MENRFTVHKAQGLSLEDIRQHNKEKHTILQTPHLGNKWRSDLIFMNYGVQVADFEGNQSKVDMLDHPDKFLLNGTSHMLSNTEQARMTPYLECNTEESINLMEDVRRALQDQFLQRSPEYLDKPGTLHAYSTYALSPDQYTLFSEYMLQDHILNTLEQLAKEGHELFRRYVTETGEMQLRNESEGKLLSGPECVAAFQTLKQRHTQMLWSGQKDNPEGPLCNNEVNVFAMVFDALHQMHEHGTLTENPEVLLVSGASMYTYLRNGKSQNGSPTYREQLSAYLATMKKHHPWLPDQVRLGIIEAPDLDWTPTTGETNTQKLLEELGEIETEMTEMNQRLIELSKQQNHQGKQAVISERNKRNKERLDLHQALQTATAQQPRISQYDLLLTNTRLHLPETLTHLPLNKLKLCGPK